ncbi:unnamed protein product, partial [Polarella glacialis]
RAKLMAKIKELEDAMERLKASLQESFKEEPEEQTEQATTCPTCGSSACTSTNCVAVVQAPAQSPREKKVQKQRIPGLKKTVAVAMQVKATRGIFKRLHDDASLRVTRMICRRDDSDAERVWTLEEISEVRRPSSPGRAQVSTQLSAAAQQLDRCGPPARFLEQWRQFEKASLLPGHGSGTVSEAALGSKRAVRMQPAEEQPSAELREPGSPIVEKKGLDREASPSEAQAVSAQKLQLQPPWQWVPLAPQVSQVSPPQVSSVAESAGFSPPGEEHPRVELTAFSTASYCNL